VLVFVNEEVFMMRRLMAVSTGALFVAAFVGFSSVGVQAADKTVNGTVSAVSPDSITINGKEAGKDVEWKLTVDSKTKVVGTGVGTKEAKLKEEKKSPQIIDFVKAGDQVSARYDDVSKLVSQVRITKAAAK
jgi:hypothetical protein